ncbi:uncharacterized protein LOC130667577 [Microplitis mediator]|uniref:uncharacterized protein LOC130667577 n=1 Tax=Microplitis mediator TaxID=375433 RepID=UPI0025523469|nr:uncharacterized protein LOC130667577 [Microplitis mediator]
MIFQLLILFLNTGILVHSRLVSRHHSFGENNTDYETMDKWTMNHNRPFNKSSNMLYGWDVEIKTDNEWGKCFGTFIAPRVYITDPVCLESHNIMDDTARIVIGKEYDGKKIRDDIKVNVNEIFYSEDFNQLFNKNKRKIAVVITDEPVGPEQDKNGYVKINSNLDDIYTDKCYVPQYNGRETTFTYCDFVVFDNRFGNPTNIYCFGSQDFPSSGSGLFCALKTNLKVDVLVGIIAGKSHGYKFWRSSNLFTAVVENISGLNETIMSNVDDELNYLTYIQGLTLE